MGGSIMRVGIMGGTLDPVHNGHIRMAQAALELLKLDRVMLLPAGDPPHKSNPTCKEDRLQMARLAAQECEGLFACGIEIHRSGTTYTVDTLTQLHSSNPNTQWFYIIGADTLDVLHTWRRYPEVMQLCTFAVFGRADENVNPDRIHQYERDYGAKFCVMPFNGPDISSTAVRERAARGENVSDLVPTSVCNYIKDRGLYLCKHSKGEILRMLQKNLKPSRFEHTLSVAETAVRLAPAYGIEPACAELAALLHDCAKYMPLQQLREMVENHVPDADDMEMEAVSVLHAPAGAVYAWREYGVRDREILSAIRKHTIGDASMSPLEALIYTADFIEPLREDFPGLKRARELAETDLYAAMCECARLTNSHVQSQGRQPHPRSLAMLKQYSNHIKEEHI